MAMVKINTAYNVNIDFELAGLDKRFFAWLIDFFVRAIYVYIIFKVLTSIYNDSDLDYEERSEKIIVAYVVTMIPIYFYFLFFEVFFNGQSIGKKILKIRVASIEGYKPTATQYLTRWVIRLVDLGFISIIFLGMGGLLGTWVGRLAFIIPNIIAIILLLNSKKEQRLGDLASGTVVIKLNPSTQISDTIFEAVGKEYKVVYNNVLKLSDRDITIIKTAMQGYEKSGNDSTLWLIAQKLQQVLGISEIGDPYYMLDTVLKDYNYLSAH
jgi:uncharacterized RDD family membrane protein YckC